MNTPTPHANQELTNEHLSNETLTAAARLVTRCAAATSVAALASTWNDILATEDVTDVIAALRHAAARTLAILPPSVDMGTVAIAAVTGAPAGQPVTARMALDTFSALRNPGARRIDEVTDLCVLTLTLPYLAAAAGLDTGGLLGAGADA